MRCPVCHSRNAALRTGTPFGDRILYVGSCPQCRASLRAVTGGSVEYAWDIRDEGRHRRRLVPLRKCPAVLYLPPRREETAVSGAWRAFRRRFGREAGLAAAGEYGAFLGALSNPVVWLPPAWFPDCPSLLAERMLKAALPCKIYTPWETLMGLEAFDG